MRSEAAYQAKLIQKLQIIFPNAFIIKNDPDEYQGIPDLLVLIGDSWFMLELKLEPNSPVQPNQAYYVDMFNGMSFASFINPENEEQVLSDLQSTFRPVREARIS